MLRIGKAVGAQRAAQEAGVAAGDEEADRGELVHRVAEHRRLEIEQAVQSPAVRALRDRQVLAHHFGVQQGGL